MVNCNINNNLFDNNINKEIYFFNNSKSIDLYDTKSDILVENDIKNNLEHSFELSILKYLDIYKSIKLNFNKMEKDLIDHNIDLANKIYRLEKRIYNTTNIINEIIDDYYINNN